MKKFVCIFLFFIMLSTTAFCQYELSVPTSAEATGLRIDGQSAILIEGASGQILYEYDPDVKLPPASITKIMTMLLIVEAIDSGALSRDEMVTASEKAKQMTGSRIFLDTGEQMSVNDMLKGIAVSSGNDASVAMAEHMAGSEDAFVVRMNARAKELGMTNTNFVNAHGLDVDGHYASARDVATMSFELFKHDTIKEYTSIWMDSLRGGTFELVNTNRLLRFYPGANGLKTGSTGNAGYCVSAAAMRDGMQLIAVVMGAENSEDRFEDAKRMLDYGFANFVTAGEKADGTPIGEIRVTKGKAATIEVQAGSNLQAIIPKGKQGQVRREIHINEVVAAPFEKGAVVGKVQYMLDDEVISSADVVVSEGSGRRGLFGTFGVTFQHLFEF